MSASVQPDFPPLATDVRVDNEHLWVLLTNGVTLRAPIAWYPRLQAATPAQRDDWELMGRGAGIHWEAIDEDVSVLRLLGRPDL